MKSSAATALQFFFGELWIAFRSAIDSRRIRRKLAISSGRNCVSLGAGATTPPGWIGVDLHGGKGIYVSDLRRPMPFSTASVDALLAEHVLEHLYLDDVRILLDECRRVLRPSCAIRIVSPDARFLARMILYPETQEVQEQVSADSAIHRWNCGPLRIWKAINRLSHQWGEHRSLLTPELLTLLLDAAGFVGICQVSPRESIYFSDVPSTHSRRFPSAKLEEFCIEAIVPP